MRTDDDTTLSSIEIFWSDTWEPKISTTRATKPPPGGISSVLELFKNFIMDALYLHLSLSKVWMNTMCYIDSYHTLSI
jgi:hypothetical protein